MSFQKVSVRFRIKSELTGTLTEKSNLYIWLRVYFNDNLRYETAMCVECICTTIQTKASTFEELISTFMNFKFEYLFQEHVLKIGVSFNLNDLTDQTRIFLCFHMRSIVQKSLSSNISSQTMLLTKVNCILMGTINYVV